MSMNRLLLEMFAARATSTGGSPALAEMLGRMRSGSGASGMNVQDILAQLGTTNPAAAKLAAEFAESNAVARPEREVVTIDADPQDHGDTVEREQHDARECDAALQELRTYAKSMFAELTVLRERTDFIAAALGACCLCWGHDPRCRNCRGRGVPGFSLPDETLFRELVLPAVQLLRAVRSGDSHLRGPASATTAERHPSGESTT